MWVEETKNGKYKAVERYTDYLSGKQRKVSVTMEKNTSQSRKVAQKALESKIEDALQTLTEKEYTLSELVAEYRKEQNTTVKKSTYRRNFHVCNTLMKILGENTLVNRLTAKYIRERLLNTGENAGYLNEKLIRLKALLRWGYQNDYLKEISFLDKLEAFQDISHREKIQDKYLESKELKELLSVMDIDVWRGITELLALTGLRMGEMVALENRDIDMEQRIIHITKTFDANNLVTTTTKTLTSTRDIYIQDELIDVIRGLRTLMLRQKIKYGYAAPVLFLTDCNGDNIKYYAYRKYLKEKAVKAIGRPITPHTLRHTHASLLMENGVSVDAISRRLGHEDSKVTKEIYLHVTEKLKEKDNKQIASIRII